MITIANLKQAKTDEEIKKLTINNVKTAYHDLALDYNHLLDLDYVYCPHCGKWKNVKSFYSNNKNKSGIEHFACKECILDMCTDLSKDGVRTDNKQKTISTFRRLNWYFNEMYYDEQLKTLKEGVSEKLRSTAAQTLIVMVQSLKQYKNKTWDDSEFISGDDSSENSSKIIQKTLKAAKKRFGSSYNDEDLMFLENEYEDWVSRYECNTKAQETIFERLAFKKWEINKATMAGQSTKDLDKTYTDLLSSINILPRQNSANGISDSLSFGQLIEKWEENEPVYDPDPEFADCDNIGKYIRVWFKGHLARALGLDNGYSKEYDDYISQYTVKKPEYEDDGKSEDIYQKLFGKETE